jgi:uncharacterized protein YjbJ (UPF0337 family)
VSTHCFGCDENQHIGLEGIYTFSAHRLQVINPIYELLYEQRLTNIHTKEYVMNKDQVKGKMDQAKGSIKETVGKVTGNTSQKVEGKFDKATGKARETYGNLKEDAE